MFVWSIFTNIIYTFLVNRVYTYFIKTKKITWRSYERTLMAQITNHEDSDEWPGKKCKNNKKELKKESDCHNPYIR
jgi:hypothetical protein